MPGQGVGGIDVEVTCRRGLPISCSRSPGRRAGRGGRPPASAKEGPMRNRIMLASALLLLAACGDKEGPTAPRTSTELQDAPQVQDLRGPGVNAAGKPAQAFTTVIYIPSPETFHLLKPETLLTGMVSCPAGSKVIG